ncbi:hypothetical protein XOC_0308 [Xanthomonas oryzae pv. oryzicola BLS256]|uniref:Uncharacterized protein n=1 Tax=Xanthomonas oryzae pv. oryzicola (strain BLS256) TaxID=383407 RepID=G7TKM9_XANOB|nr:hypothetical protein XOC_0308 [Xanthomonas oryzae pv. oryzicola BLS256]QEO99653.1 hypothetical protein XOCgx_4666 [Xanthomonas oryzae pv. oryzicola]
MWLMPVRNARPAGTHFIEEVDLAMSAAHSNGGRPVWKTTQLH